MSAEILIRRAKSDDAAAIAALLDELGYPAEGSAVGGRIARVAKDKSGCLLVAEQAGQIVGMAGFHAIPLVHEDGLMGRITALVVKEIRRGEGIGRLLVRRIEETGRALGCSRMEITSSRHRTHAHHFYEALGYDAGGHHRFVKRL